MKQFLTPLAALACFQTLLLIGCGGRTAPSVSDRRSQAMMRMVGVEYGRYLAEHNGAPPADEAAFRTFVDAQIAKTPDYGVKNAEELFNCSRDGQSLKIVVGTKVTVPDQTDQAWAAYEQTGVDGKRLAVNTRGAAVELGADEFSQSFPSK